MIGSDEKVERIKKVAFNMFLEIGFEATSVRMICKEAGIESPTLYYFFNSKMGLYFDIRSSLEDEYRKLVIELSLEKEKSPEDALKKYFKFCIDYATNNPDKTRFYLRYQLFRPFELRDQIEEIIKKTKEEKKQLYGKYLKECIDLHQIDYTLDEAFKMYSDFIDNNAFNIIFSDWRPTEEDKNKAWRIFFNNYLKREV